MTSPCTPENALKDLEKCLLFLASCFVIFMITFLIKRVFLAFFFKDTCSLFALFGIVYLSFIRSTDCVIRVIYKEKK